MRFFARYHFHGGRGMGLPDIVTYDASGHPHYHLFSILVTAGLLGFAAFYLWIKLTQRDLVNQPIPARYLIGAGIGLLLLILTGCILVRDPTYVWF